MADSMSERSAFKKLSVKLKSAGCRQFSRGRLIQINVEIETMVGTTHLPAIAGFHDPVRGQ
jgi:hypothetical protein